MLQTAAARTPHNANALDVPILFVNPRMYKLVQIMAFSSVVAELWMGFSLFRWIGLVIWLPFIIVGNLIFPGKNPGPCFFVGIVVTTLGVALLALAP